MLGFDTPDKHILYCAERSRRTLPQKLISAWQRPSAHKSTLPHLYGFLSYLILTFLQWMGQADVMAHTFYPKANLPRY